MRSSEASQHNRSTYPHHLMRARESNKPQKATTYSERTFNGPNGFPPEAGKAPRRTSPELTRPYKGHQGDWCSLSIADDRQEESDDGENRGQEAAGPVRRVEWAGK